MYRVLLLLSFTMVACAGESPEGANQSPPAESSTTSSAESTEVARSLVPASSLDSDEVYNVGGDVLPPRAIERHELEIPEDLRSTPRSGGVILLEAVIDQDGAVRDVVVKNPHSDPLEPLAVAALRKWKFEPGTRNGRPVAVRFMLTVNIEVRR